MLSLHSEFRTMATSTLLNVGPFKTLQISWTKSLNLERPRTQQVLSFSKECDFNPSITEAVKASSPSSFRRRDALQLLTVAAAAAAFFTSKQQEDAIAAGLPQEEPAKLCDDVCEKELENIPMVTTESGLQYKDIKVGTGPNPPVGYQVAANYVAMVPSGKIFDSSLEKGVPYIFRVGSGQVVKGLDEGILTMKVGGKRRLYVPGPLAFPKGLPAAAGRPRVLPSSPVIFDVSLEYVPGLDDVDE